MVADSKKRRENAGNISLSDKTTSGSSKPNGSDKEAHTATWGEVFMFATKLDWLLMVVGSLFAMFKGCLLPIMVINFSSITASFVGTYKDTSSHDAAAGKNNNTSVVASAIVNLTTTTLATPSAITYTLFGPIQTDTCFDLTNADELSRYERSNLISTHPNLAVSDPLASWTALPIHCKTTVLDQAGGDIVQNVYNFLWLALATFVTSYVYSLCWNIAAARQCAVMRREMFRGIMRQDIGWFDGQNTRRLPTQLSESVAKVLEGMQKLGMLFENVTGFVASFIVALIYGWELGLVIMGICPFIAFGGALMIQVSSRAATNELAAYSKAGAVAEETFTNIRTVAALGCEQKQTDRYAMNLSSATTAGIRKGVAVGVGQGFMWAIMFMSYALAFGFGAWLVRRSIINGDGRYSVGTILLVFFAVLVGAMQLGQVMPNLQVASNSRAAAYVVVAIVKRRPPIDSGSDGGQRPTPIRGKISFRDISFRYPARPEVEILDKLSLEIEPGTTVALVGASGCGKSTLIQLVERFYDPDAGTVLLDDVDLRHWNVSHLRNVVGIVAQEPVLFETTIGENIRYGRGDATQAEIDEACRKANIYDFINSLPQKFDTQVGQKGSQLSGGEKQRIAIARALLKVPAVLLLDEATSALDSVSERLVQQAIDMATVGSRRTVLVVAHRLSTIRNADRIVALKDGRVLESGTHNELMDKGGLYYALVQAQTNAPPEENKESSTVKRNMAYNDNGSVNGSDPQAVIDEIEEIQPNSTFSTTNEDSEGENTGSTAEVQEFVDETLNTKALANTTTGAVLPVARSTAKISVDNDTVLTGSGRRASNTTTEEAATVSNKVGHSQSKTDDDIGNPQMGRLIRINAPEWWLICLGVLGALCAGAIMPVYAVLLSEMLKVFAEPDLDKQASGALFWSGMFLVLGAVCFFANVFQFSMLGVAGERLTTRLRKRLFAAIVRQDMEFFDWPKNNVGALTTKLATDAATVQAATGSALALILQSLCTLIVAFAIGFFYAWKVVLVLLGTIPFIIIGSFIEQKLIAGQAKGSQQALENASSVVTEAIEQIRTVAMLNLEPRFVGEFENRMRKANRDGILRAFLVAIAFGYSQAVSFLIFALAFWSGWQFIRSSWLNDDERVKFDFSDIMKALMGIMFGAISIGQASSFGQSFGKAKISSARIFKLIDTKPKIDVTDQSGLRPMEGLKGDVVFEKLKFRYPTRPAMPLLRGLTLQVEHGQSLALVGHSGCGKSTVIQLLERFYEPLEGEIVLDGKPLKAYNLRWLRQQLGLVGQEPVLFGGTVRENIGYGCETTPTHEEIVAAAQDANIHTFVMQLPQQYDTFLGDKGAQLSGGQKQRIAIARALIRKPRLLLLDEATSALDTESEHVVQEALTRAMQGRTSITIAHRLNTIENCDAIAVINKGRLAEFGTHKQLMQLGNEGLYYKAQTTLKEGARGAAALAS